MEKQRMLISLWQKQELFFHVYFVGLISAGWWNFQYAGEHAICMGEPLSHATRRNLLPVLGASIALLLAFIGKTGIEATGFSFNGFKHPYATRMALLIMFAQVLSLSGICSGFIASTCIHFLGVYTPPLLWLDWLLTVPFLFFLTACLDVKKMEMTETDKLVQIVGGGSIVLLFLGMFPTLSITTHWVLFITSNIGMIWALAVQQLTAYRERVGAVAELSKIPRKYWDDVVNSDIADGLRVSEWKWNISMVTAIMYTIIPLVFYAQVFDLIEEEVFVPLLYAMGFFAKTMMCSLALDAHIDILDVNRMAYIQEKRRSEEMRSMFLRYIFHEVRVPLNSLSMGLQLMGDSGNLDDQEMDNIVMMREAVVFMNETLNDVLSLQKIEEGKLELEKVQFEPHTIVASMLNNLRSQYGSKRITVTAEVKAGTPLSVYGDKFRLEHVLGNLLSNAIKFSDEGSDIRIMVEVGGKEDIINDDKYLFYTVKDHGPGISKKDQQNLFQPFMQIRPGELQKGRGSGLGLSICKTIMKLHQGVISCNSKLREGSDVQSGGSAFYFGVDLSITASTTQSTAETMLSTLTAGKEGTTTGQHLPGAKSAVNLRKIGSLDSGAFEWTTDASEFDSGEDATELNSFKIPRRFDWQSYKVVTSGASSAHSPRESDSTFAPVYPQTENVAMFKAFLGSKDDASAKFSGGFQNASSENSNLDTATNATAATAATTASDRETSPVVSAFRHVDSDSESEAAAVNASTHTSHSQVRSATRKDSSATVTSTDTVSVRSIEKSPQRSIMEVSAEVHQAVQKILICDDVLSNRKMLEMILKRKGLNCDKAENGQQAVDRVKEAGLGFYDLIFMDSVMPVMCGTEAVKVIRKLGYRNMLIGLTGNAMDVDIADFEEAGVDLVLIKPLKLERLDSVLQYCGKFGVHSRYGTTSEATAEAETLKHWIALHEGT